jgi:hypothetical protein
MSTEIANCKSNSVCGMFRLRRGWLGTKHHLDIHLVRIMFLEILNLPTNFAYNE